MTRADVLRQRAAEYELRAQSLSDAATVDPAATQASNFNAQVAVVLYELADLEETVAA